MSRTSEPATIPQHRRRDRPRRRRAAAAPVTVLLATALAVAACTGTSGTQVATRAETTVPRKTTTTAPPDCAQMLPPEGRAAQLLMAMTSAPARIQPLVSQGVVGGFAFTGEQSSQVATQVADTVTEAPLPVIVASDEEGGEVQRLRNSAGRLAAAATLGEGTPQDAATATGEHAAKVAQQGVTMVFAPVADAGTGSGLGTRTYGSDPAAVAEYVAAVLPAISDNGLVPVVKHWPGIGRGSADPHQRLTTLADIATLRTRDLVPFDRAIAAGAPAIMITHAVVPGLTGPREPTSLSRAAITDELRGRQGFQGLVITDDLGMAPITNLTTQAEAAELAVAAGADIALVNGNDEAVAARDRLVDAITSGRIPEEQVLTSVRRVLAAKGVTGQCLDAVARYSAIERGNVTGSDSTLPASSVPGSATSVSTTLAEGADATPGQTPGAGTVVRTGPPTTRAPGGSGTTTTVVRTTTTAP